MKEQHMKITASQHDAALRACRKIRMLTSSNESALLPGSQSITAGKALSVLNALLMCHVTNEHAPTSILRQSREIATLLQEEI